MATKDITVDGNLTNNTTLATTDRLLLIDDGSTVLQDTTIGVLNTYVHTQVNGLTEDTTPDGAADFLPTYDTSAGGPKKASPHNLLKVVNGLTEDTAPDPNSDFLLSYDASAGGPKKIKHTNVGRAIVHKSSDETISSNATLQNDDALVFPVIANKNYHFRILLYFTAANTTMDIKVGWTVPASATMAWGVYVPAQAGLYGISASIPAAAADVVATEATSISFGSSAGSTILIFEGLIFVDGTAGNIQFQWAQGTSNGSNLTVKAGSFIEYRQLN